MPDKEKCLAIPPTLSIDGKRAAMLILEILKKDGDDDPGGCTTFYDPAAWAEKGEEFGLQSKLIVCHDGGDFAPWFNWDYQQYSQIEMMREELEKIGMYAEQCTSWYSAIYLEDK